MKFAAQIAFAISAFALHAVTSAQTGPQRPNGVTYTHRFGPSAATSADLIPQNRTKSCVSFSANCPNERSGLS